jgi:Na+/H+ antiporter NhaD/arsenite permease-like protein
MAATLKLHCNIPLSVKKNIQIKINTFRLLRYFLVCTTNKSSFVASFGTAILLSSTSPAVFNNLKMLPHLPASKGWIFSNPRKRTLYSGR